MWQGSTKRQSSVKYILLVYMCKNHCFLLMHRAIYATNVACPFLGLVVLCMNPGMTGYYPNIAVFTGESIHPLGTRTSIVVESRCVQVENMNSPSGLRVW